MRRLHEYDFAVFDCDGVILQSNAIKTEAFARAVEGTPEQIAEFVQYHRTHGGISRYVKFRHYYDAIAPVDHPETHVEAALKGYQHLVEEQLVSCPPVDGVERVLDYLHRRGVPCYVCSGGDEEELRRVFALRKLAPFFSDIWGSPKTKSNIMASIRKLHPLNKGVYFGDSYSDCQTAVEFRAEFVFVSQFSEWKEGTAFCGAHHIDQIVNFNDLLLEAGPLGDGEVYDGRSSSVNHGKLPDWSNRSGASRKGRGE